MGNQVHLLMAFWPLSDGACEQGARLDHCYRCRNAHRHYFPRVAHQTPRKGFLHATLLAQAPNRFQHLDYQTEAQGFPSLGIWRFRLCLLFRLLVSCSSGVLLFDLLVSAFFLSIAGARFDLIRS